jgi:hypothetical protein
MRESLPQLDARVPVGEKRQVRLSVVIVNWNSKDDLTGCLAALYEQTYEDAEVIVVDNGSVDGSVAAVRERFPRVRLLAETENLGFAEGCNRGIEVATGEWVVLLNNDTVAERTFLAAFAAAAENAPADVGMLQALMLYQGRPGVVNSTGLLLKRNGGGGDRGEGEPRERWREAGPVFCPTGGAAAYRRTMLDAVKLPTGWLDRDYFLYYEDLDLGWRARLAGWSATYVPDAVVHHRWHGSSDRHGKRRLDEYATVNRLRTLVKNASPGLWITAGLPTLVGQARILVRSRGTVASRIARGFAEARLLRPIVSALTKVDRRALEREWARG